MKYLIPIDGSTASLRAVHHVLHEREHWQAKPGDPQVAMPSVVLLSVQPLMSQHAARFLTHGQRQQFRQERARQALQGASDLLKEAGVPFTSMIADGEVSEVVIRESARLGIDEIVMGVSRKPAWVRGLLPSISRHIIDGANRPVAVLSDGQPGPLSRYMLPAGIGVGLTMLVLAD